MLAGVDEDHRRRLVDRDTMCSSAAASAPKLDTSAMRPGNRSSIASRMSEVALTLAKRRLEPRGGDLVAEQLDVVRAHQMSDPALRS